MRHSGKQEWSMEEMQLLKELYPLFNSKKWKNISQKFSIKGYNRSVIECRQKWINFLDPRLKSSEWSQQELKTMYKAYDKHKTQWCILQKTLPGRSQNKIKNKFYGNLRNMIRIIIKVFNKKKQCYSKYINQLSPKFLNMMYNSKGRFSFMDNQIPSLIQDSEFIYDKFYIEKRVKSKRDLYEKTFYELVEIFKTTKLKKESKQQHRNQEAFQAGSVQLAQIPEGCEKNQQNLPIMATNFSFYNPMVYPMYYHFLPPYSVGY